MKTEYKIPTSVQHPTRKEDENVCRSLTMKVCTICGIEKVEKKEFYKRTNGNYHASCKKCQKENKKKYYKENVERIKKYRKEYYAKNKTKIRKKEAEYRKNRCKIDPVFKLTLRVRNHTNQFLKEKKINSTTKYLGCTPEELKTYIESKFIKGMNWENYGEWHIDHIFPLSKVDISNKQLVKKVLHYTNLQPLWAKDNISKGNKIL